MLLFIINNQLLFVVYTYRMCYCLMLLSYIYSIIVEILHVNEKYYKPDVVHPEDTKLPDCVDMHNKPHSNQKTNIQYNLP